VTFDDIKSLSHFNIIPYICNVIEYEAPLYKPHFLVLLHPVILFIFNKLRDESFNNLLRSTVIKMHI